MGFKIGGLLVVMGAFLTFAYIHSTSVFDPQAFGVALMVAGLLDVTSELRSLAPRRRWLVVFDRPGTVLPPAGHH